MANTFELIASYTVSSPQASYTFSSIPGTYTDLCVKVSGRSSTTQGTGGFTCYIYPNGSTSSMTNIQLRGSGSAASSPNGQTNPVNVSASDTTANTFGSSEVYIPNYAGSTNKSISVDGVEENNASNAYMSMNANLWSNTSAITSLQFTAFGGGNFATNSTFYLYGVKNA